MKVYVAAASSEIERAEKCIAALRASGFEVTSTWPEVIRKVGHANPMTASREQRAGWAAMDLSEVSDATVLWFLIPPKGVATDGANVEYGYALFLGAASQEARLAGINAPIYRILTSGEERSIFTALSTHFDTDEQAIEALKVQRNFENMLRPKTKSPEDAPGAALDAPSSDGG